MKIIRRGKFLSEEEHQAFIELTIKGVFQQMTSFLSLRIKKTSLTCFLLTVLCFKISGIDKVFKSIIKSLRQPAIGCDAPVFHYSLRAKKYDRIKKINEYSDVIARKILKSTINSLRQRPELAEEVKNILAMFTMAKSCKI